MPTRKFDPSVSVAFRAATLRPLTPGTAIFTMAIGAVALVGWLLDLPMLYQYPAGLPGINANSALGLLVIGLALLLLGRTDRPPRVVRAGRGLACISILLGGLTLVQYLLDVDLRFDQLIAHEPPGAIGTDAPSRMAAMTAVNFVLKGWALLALDRPPRRGSMTQAQFLSLLTALGPMAVLLSYVFGVHDVRRSGPYFFFSHMSLPVAIAWLAMSVGTLFARTDVGIMRALTRSTFASFTLRRLLIPVLLVPPLLTGLLYAEMHQRLAMPGYGAAVLAVIGMSALAVAVWRTVAGIETLELRELEAEAARRRLESDLETLFDLAPTGMAQIDMETGQLMRVNHRLCEMTGYDEAELLTKSIQELTHPDDIAAQKLELRKVPAAGGPFSMDKRYVRKDGSALWAHVSGLVLSDPRAESRGLAIIQDMTRMKEEEEALLRAKQIAESASQMKTAFLANMSHELRTPLTAVAGFAELLLDDAASAEDKKAFVAAIRRNGEALTRIIDDILDLSKVEAGKIELETLSVSVPDLLMDVTTLLKPRAEEKGIALTVDAEGPIPERITSDPVRLRQILLNIIGNAIKFTQRGVVRVRVRLQSVRPARDEGKLAVVVEDTGPGIEEWQRPRLFQPFSQADSSTTRRYGGTGLGLALSKQLAEALGGDVELTASVPGRGSTFTITVGTGPLRDVALISSLAKAPVAAELDPALRGKRLLGKRVLLAEDAPDNQLLVKKLLSIQGAEVAVAANGREAVQEALSHDYDVVLMDLQMPEMDGFDATRLLRRQGYSRPIIALTAHAMKEERDRSLAAGCDGHLTKPVDIDALVQTLSRIPGPDVGARIGT